MPGKGQAPPSPPIPTPVRTWFNNLVKAGARNRCHFWNAGSCTYSNQCNFQHTNMACGRRAIYSVQGRRL